MISARLALLFALFTPAALAADRLVLAPGRSVTLLNAAEPSLRVVLTAPTDRPLDVSALIGGMRASELYSLAARAPAQANAIVRNADGSVSLGTKPPSVPPAVMLQDGVIVVDGAKVSHYPEAPAASPAFNPIEGALRRMDEPPVKGPVNLVGGGAGNLFLPSGTRIR